MPDLQFAIRAINEASRTLREVQGDIDRVGTSSEKSSGLLGKFGSGLGSVAAIAGGFVVADVLMRVPGLLNGAAASASDLNETLSKSNAVFKEQAAAVEAWANGAARGFGQSKQQALDAASGFGNMFSQLGIGRDVAADMSRQMVELASDFAAFHNVADVSQVLEAQSAAFRGEYDAVQRFVPTINAALVEQKAMQMGLAATTKELDAQDKALAVQALLLEGAGDAAGAYARESDGLATKQKEQAALWANVATQIGEKVLPLKLALADVVLDRLIPAFEKVWPVVEQAAGWLARLYSTEFRLLQAGIDALEPYFAKFTEYYQTDIKPALDNIATAVGVLIDFIVARFNELMPILGPVLDQFVLVFQTAWGIVSEIVQIAIDLIGGDFGGAWTNLQQLVVVVWDGIVGTVRNAINLILGLGATIFNAGKSLGESLFDGLRSALSSVGGLALDIASAVGSAIKAFINNQVIARINRAVEFSIFIPNPFGEPFRFPIDPPDIPFLAQGGIVTRPTLAVLGEAGPEAVVPLGRGVGTGVGATYHIVVNALDARTAADAVLEALVNLENSGRLTPGVTAA